MAPASALLPPGLSLSTDPSLPPHFPRWAWRVRGRYSAAPSLHPAAGSSARNNSRRPPPDPSLPLLSERLVTQGQVRRLGRLTGAVLGGPEPAPLREAEPGTKALEITRCTRSVAKPREAKRSEV
jgi:hypothetical protein